MRIKNGYIVILAISFLLCVSPFGCGKGEKAESNRPVEYEAAESSTPVEGEPSDYFPTNTGTTWVYEIEIGEVEPLDYRETWWSLSNGKAFCYEMRGRFRALMEDTAPKTFVLEMKVKGPADEQGPLEYPLGVELEIEKDELGIFEDTKQVFWAITSHDRFTVNEVITYSPHSSYSPGYPFVGEGYSIRLVFFGGKPGLMIPIGEQSKDALLFNGVDTKVSEYEGIPLLNFIRTVEPGEKNDYINKGFSEDMWFAKGKGLVRLEQKVDGEVSMTWNLVEFSE